MPYRLEFEIVGLPRMTNKSGKSGHWRVLHSEATLWKQLTGWAVRKHSRPPTPLKHARLTLTRHSSAAPDSDGLVSGFKHVIDGLVEAGVLENDRWINIGMPTYRWSKAPMKAGKITVVVEECEGPPTPSVS